jgi:hypothetical protein
VKISGVGLEEAASVQVGNWLAPASAFHVLSPTALELQMPPARETLPAETPPVQDGAGPAQVLVTLKDGQSTPTGAASTFEYLQAGSHGSVPSVTGVIPTGGSESAPAPVTVLGGDFTGASSVTFGGVAAKSFEVRSDSEISVTPPAYSSGTACAALPATGVYAGENAGNDICQVQVVVHDHDGASPTGAILPPFEGTQTFQQDGALEAPPGCGCEIYPSPTEYDYAPAPAISSVSTSEGPADMASEKGGTLVTIHGSGLGRFTFDYTSWGEPQLESSIGLVPPAYITGTEIQVQAPGLPGYEEAPTVQARSLPLTVRTLAGSSAPASVEYAGVPRVSAVINLGNTTRLNGAPGAPDTGGTPIVLRGRGLEGQVAFLHFGAEEGYSDGTQYTLTEEGEDRLAAQTVAENPALVQVEACTVTGCSPAAAGAQLYLYPPGQPLVEELSPASGKSAGGTKVLIRGQNLACPLGVSFGKKAAQSFEATEPGPCDLPTSSVEAVSPAGTPGSEVPVTVTTWESYFTGSGDAPTKALFTYK